MKVSEVIEELQKLMDEHGDVPVFYARHTDRGEAYTSSDYMDCMPYDDANHLFLDQQDIDDIKTWCRDPQFNYAIRMWLD